jgi:hypothetical protein
MNGNDKCSEITVRDMIAIEAMKSLISRCDPTMCYYDVCKVAYIFADAMIDISNGIEHKDHPKTEVDNKAKEK